MLFVVGLLEGAAGGCGVEGFLDGGGDSVGVHDDTAGDVAGCASAGLDEGGFTAEEAFFVGVEDGNECHFGDLEAFAEEIDADEDVEEAEVVDDLDALEGVDVGVEVFGFDSDLGEVAAEVFGEFFGEEDAASFLGFEADLFEAVVDLGGGGFNFDGRVE